MYPIDYVEPIVFVEPVKSGGELGIDEDRRCVILNFLDEADEVDDPAQIDQN